MLLLPIVLVFLCLTSPAYAEWEVALYGGKSFTKDITFTDNVIGLTLYDFKTQSSGTAGGKVGYWFTNVSDIVSIGAGLDAFYFRSDIDPQLVNASLGDFRAQLDIPAGVTIKTVGLGFDVLKARLNLLRDAAFPHGRLQPMVSAGPALFWTHLRSVELDRHDTSLGYKLAGGIQFYVTPAFSAFAEYRFTHFRLEFDSVDLYYIGYVTTHHAVGGFALHF